MCLALLALAALVSVHRIAAAQASAPVVSRGDVHFIPGPRGAAVDDPIWLNDHALLVTTWNHYNPSLAQVHLADGDFKQVPTLKISGCGLTTARFATRKGEHAIAYLADCFRPGQSRAINPISEFGVLDVNNHRNRRFGSIALPLGSTGRFTFSPDGTRAVLASGGLYSQLEWLAPEKLTRLRQGLASAAAPTWSPDGHLIVFGGVPEDAKEITTDPTDLYTFRPTEPGKLHLVARGLENFEPSGVAWMPSSSRWFIANLQPAREPAGLWLVDANTGRKVLLLEGSEFGRPGVSADGRTLAVGVGVDAEFQKDTSGHVGLDLVRLAPLTRLRSLVR
jgi:Tol biopolymer transport system component